MLLPIRCFTCGEVIGDKWEMYQTLLSKYNQDANKALNEIGLLDYCCRRMILAHVDLFLFLLPPVKAKV